MKVRTHRRTPRWVLVTRVIAFVVLVILLYLSPRLFAADGAIDLGLKWTADRINFHLEHQAGYYEGESK